MEEPKVSIIIPTYNMAASLEAAVDSVIAQTYKNWELLIIDDFSQDNTPALAASFVSRKNVNVRYVRCQNNVGRSAALNLGLRQSEGVYVALLDADDTITQVSLKRRVDYLAANPEKSAVFADTFYVDRSGLIYAVRIPSTKFQKSSDKAMDFLGSIMMEFHPMTLMYRREVFERIGFFDESLRRKQDGDLVFRLLSQCDVGYVASQVYNYSVDGTTIRRIRKRLRGMISQQQILKKHTKGLDRLRLSVKLGIVDFLKLLYESVSYKK
jgi:glycosyltransferase involved in cell wall biosynthesis